jgi:hypothetical protein
MCLTVCSYSRARLSSRSERWSRFFFRSWVGLIVYLRKVLEIQVGVDLGRADIRVPKQFLDGAQITRGFEQVGSEAVTEHVGMQTAIGTARLRPLREPCLHRAGMDACPAVADEQGRLIRAGEVGANPQPLLDSVTGLAADWDATGLGTFTEHR